MKIPKEIGNEDLTFIANLAWFIVTQTSSFGPTFMDEKIQQWFYHLQQLQKKIQTKLQQLQPQQDELRGYRTTGKRKITTY